MSHILDIIKQRHLLGRYISIGIFVALFQMTIFLLLFSLLKLDYLFSSTIAFIFTIFLSFYLQRKVVFVVDGDRALRTHTALVITCFNSVIGLGLNYLIMYVGVEYLYSSAKFWQFISMVVLALYNFFVYKFLFRSVTL